MWKAVKWLGLYVIGFLISGALYRLLGDHAVWFATGFILAVLIMIIDQHFNADTPPGTSRGGRPS